MELIYQIIIFVYYIFFIRCDIILNNIIELYNPYGTSAYISSVNNEKGDLFITTNELLGASDKKSVYAFKSDGSNYFSDNDEPYIIFETINNTRDYGKNIYPQITPLIINNKEHLATFSHEGAFELFDFDLKKWYILQKTKVISENSEINRNSFIHLKYYNYANYILNIFVAKGNKRIVNQLLYYEKTDITNKYPNEITKLYINYVLKTIPITCFEIENLIECFYANLNYLYIITIFDLQNNLNQVYNATLDNNLITSDYIFSKCIYVKDNIGAFFYYLSNNKSPYLFFKKLNSGSTNYELINHLGPIPINSNNNFPLNSDYLYNDIIKFDDNNIIFVSTCNNTEIIMIIKFKLLNSFQNVLINYYQLDLSPYNIRIYLDITIFKFSSFLGIGMTHYKTNLDDSQTYSSFFIIGSSTMNSVNSTIEINGDIFNGDSFDIQNLLSFNIDNNIFGYSLNCFRIISPLNEEELKFYLFSNEKQKKIETNEILNITDTFTFKILEGYCVEKNNYSIIFESVLNEPSYSDLNNLSDLVEYYPNSNTNLEEYYQTNDILSGKKIILNINVNECYKTCQTCSCHGNNINHYCLTCSNDYPYVYNGNDLANEISDNANNCFEECPENYIPDANNICILDTHSVTTESDTEINTNGEDIENTINEPDARITTNDPDNRVNINEPDTRNTINELDCGKNSKSKIINHICFENFEDISLRVKEISDYHLIINVH